VDNLPRFLSYQHIPGIDIDVDPLSAFMVLLVTWILCTGIKEVNFIDVLTSSLLHHFSKVLSVYVLY